MARTARRPLPSGRMSREHALAFATTAGLTGVGSLALLVNPTTAALGAATIGESQLLVWEVMGWFNVRLVSCSCHS